jgi:hypothetical protein
MCALQRALWYKRSQQQFHLRPRLFSFATYRDAKDAGWRSPEAASPTVRPSPDYWGIVIWIYTYKTRDRRKPLFCSRARAGMTFACLTQKGAGCAPVGVNSTSQKRSRFQTPHSRVSI